MKTIVIPILLIFISGVTACSDSKDQIGEKGKEIVLTLPPGPNNPRNSEADFITLKNGDILFIYSHFTGFSSEDHSPAYLASRYSTDSGRSWTTKDQIIAKPDENINLMSVSLLRLKNGSIALFYLKKRSLKDCIPMVQFSYDEAKTWSEPTPCIKDRSGYFIMNNNRAIQLENGRLLLPVSLHYTASDVVWHDKGTLMTYYSDDNGITWKSSKPVPNPSNAITQEPGLIALKDSSILMFIRTTNNVQYISRSVDLGVTWSPAIPSNIKSPLSPASIARIPATDDLLLVWNNNGGDIPAIKDRRTPFTIAISNDEGANWQRTRIIEDNPDGWYCYTAIHFSGRYILLSHSAGSVSKGTYQSVMRITRLTLDWVYTAH